MYKNDLKRAFQLRKMCIGCIGIVFVMFFSIYKMTNVTSVYRAYTDAIYFIPFMMSMTFCAIPFGRTITEDIEHEYYYMLLLRERIGKYVVSKVIVTYISAIVTMFIGVLIFVALIRVRVPWEESIVVEDALLNILGGTTYGILYFCIHSIYMGLLAGNLIVISIGVSLLWSDKLLQISMPFMLYYLLIYYSGELFPNTPQLNIQFMFNPSYNTWNDVKVSFVFPFVFSLMVASIMGGYIYKQLNKRDGK